MDVSQIDFTEPETTSHSGIVAALKKRALILMDEETFKLVLELEHVLKNTQQTLISGKPEIKPKRPHILARCEAALMKKKNLSCDISDIKEILSQGPPIPRPSPKNVVDQCKELEKSMNLLNEKCEKIQSSLKRKEQNLNEVLEENERLKKENERLNLDLAESKEAHSNLLNHFENIRAQAEPLRERSPNCGKDMHFSGCSPNIVSLSQNASPANFLFVNRSRRLLCFGNENKY